MQKLILIILISIVSLSSLNAKSKKHSSFGKWNYDKYGYAKQEIKYSKIKNINDITNECKKYIHIKTTFHVRVKNWFKYIQLGRSGYAEMKVTLGNEKKSCEIPYNIKRMDIFYDANKHAVKYDSSYFKVSLNGIGAGHECYKAIGYAFSEDGIVLPVDYHGKVKISTNSSKLPGKIDLNELFGLNVESWKIPGLKNKVPIAWFIPISFQTDEGYKISVDPHAGAILNAEKGCYKIKATFIHETF